jgi:RNA polymerase sigma factor (sigma-70 family)
VLRYCLTCLRSREEAEDAAQSTFLYAFRALERGVEPQAEAPWLFAIARNVCMARQRTRGRRRERETLQDPVLLQDVSAAPERSDGLVGIEEALAKLPQNQRRAILLREWQGLSYKEIAADLGLSGAAVETLIFRARRSLAEQLDAERAQEKPRVLRGFDIASVAAALKPVLGWGTAAKLAVAAATVATAVTVAGKTVPGEQPAAPPPAVRQVEPAADLSEHVSPGATAATPAPARGAPERRKATPERAARPERAAEEPAGTTQTGDSEPADTVDGVAGTLGDVVSKTVPALPETSLPELPELPVELPSAPELQAPDLPLP